MRVVFNGSLCEIDKKLTSEQEKLLKEMENSHFILTYYPPKDASMSSVEKITLKLKSKILR